MTDFINIQIVKRISFNFRVHGLSLYRHNNTYIEPIQRVNWPLAVIQF